MSGTPFIADGNVHTRHTLGVGWFTGPEHIGGNRRCVQVTNLSETGDTWQGTAREARRLAVKILLAAHGQEPECTCPMSIQERGEHSRGCPLWRP